MLGPVWCARGRPLFSDLIAEAGARFFEFSNALLMIFCEVRASAP